MPPLDLELIPSGGGVPDPLLSRPDMDGNGVDLSVGAYNLSATDVVIGQPGAGGLAYARSYVGGGWRSSFLGTINSAGATFIVSVNGAAEYFAYAGGVYTNDDGTASTLTSNATTFTYTTGDGTVYTFTKSLKDIVVASADEAILTSVTAPTGAVTTLHYNNASISGQIRARLQSITNSFGFQLHLTYAEDTPANAAELNGVWLKLTAIKGINLAQVYCAPTAFTCAPAGNWPQATYTGDTHQILTATDPEGRTTTYTYDGNDRIHKVEYPGSTVDNLTIGYDGLGRVTSVNRGYASWSYAYADASGNRTTTITLPGGGTQVIITNIADNTVTSVEYPLGRTTSYLYDDNGRTTRVTAPEGNYVAYTYDDRGNIKETRAVAKSGSGLADIVTSASYPGTCANPKTCNKPLTTTDARGKVTTYTYDANHGGVTSVTAPAPNGEIEPLISPESRFFYAQKRARYHDSASTYVNGPLTTVLTATAACATSAFSSAYHATATNANNNCDDGAGDKTVTETAWPGTGSANNLLPLSATARAGDSSVSSTSSFAYDARGWLSSTDGPLAGAADKTVFFYEDTGRQYGMISPDPDGAGDLKRRAARTLFDSMGLPYRVETGTATGQTESNLTSMTVQQKADTIYDEYGRPVKSIAYHNADSIILAVSQVSYDSAGRTDCVAQRMNPSIFGSPPSSACSLGTAGSYGQDRISRKVYNNAGEVVKVVYAHGTALQQDGVTATYTNNGLVSTVTDAKGNKTAYAYDGFDRLKKTCFPSKTTPGTVSTSDCEENFYTAAGLLDKVRPRKGSLASSSIWDITFAYDDLGRMTTRHVPDSGGPTESYDYAYDNFGRVTNAYHHYLNIAYTYDALSRLTSRTHDVGSWTASYEYDAASRLTKLTYPDGWDVDYGYDTLGRPTTVKHDASTLATVSYDGYGRRSSLNYGNGTGADYRYDGLGRLNELDWNLTSPGDDFGYDFSFNPSSQIVSSTVSDAGRAWSVPALGTDDYARNGLNQYEEIESASIVHDGSGNVTTDHRGRVYAYDSENRLRGATEGGVSIGYYVYSAEGAIRYRAAGGVATTRHFHDGGGQELAQYDAVSYDLQYRFVRLPGSVDDVFLMLDYVSSGCGSGCPVYVHKDIRGSTVSTSDAGGAETAAYQYSPYGESGPEGDAGFPFRFTGQRLDPATGLYDYKARFYDPETGRFLQTDPIGYADGMNMYAYVSGDPINNIDPWGLASRPKCRPQDCDEIAVTGRRGEDDTDGPGSEDYYFDWSFEEDSNSGGDGPTESIDEVVVTGARKQNNYLDGLKSMGFYCDGVCLPTIDYYFDDFGVTIVAERVDRLAQLRAQQAYYALYSDQYALEELRRQKAEFFCNAKVVGVSTLGLSAGYLKVVSRKPRLAAYGGWAVGGAAVATIGFCAWAGIMVEFETN